MDLQGLFGLVGLLNEFLHYLLRRLEEGNEDPKELREIFVEVQVLMLEQLQDFPLEVLVVAGESLVQLRALPQKDQWTHDSLLLLQLFLQEDKDLREDLFLLLEQLNSEVHTLLSESREVLSLDRD